MLNLCEPCLTCNSRAERARRSLAKCSDPQPRSGEDSRPAGPRSEPREASLIDDDGGGSGGFDDSRGSESPDYWRRCGGFDDS